MKRSGMRGLVASASLLAIGVSFGLVATQAHAASAESAGTSVPDAPQAASGGSTDAPRSIAEIVVTAQKRSERLLDVPISLTALNGADLEHAASYRIEDFAGSVPGLQIVGVGGLGTQLVIRGLTTGSGTINSSVATYIDETPYTANGSVGLSAFVSPNIDAFDMHGIEVLRGPQGTLYGANALGGLLKYETNAPDSKRFAVAGQAGVTAIDSGGTGYDLHGMVNVPLGDRLALRVVGYTNEYPGFIDDPLRGLKNINTSFVSGGRASLLYKPTDDLSIRMTASYQRRTFNDSGYETVQPFTLQPVYGSLQKETLIGNPGHVENQVYNLTIDYKLSFARLISSTSYTRYNSVLLSDASTLYSPILNPIFAGIFGFNVPYGLALPQPAGNHALTQEIRLSSLPNRPLEWQVGGYFDDQSGFLNQYTYPIDPVSRQILYTFPINTGGFLFNSTYREYAAFANLDWHITPTVDVAAGGRYSHNSQNFAETGFGLLGGAAQFGKPDSEGVFTFSTDARWHIQPSIMLYARIAEGFVPGGPNALIPTANSTIPTVYQSSTTINYEAGIKAGLDHNRIIFELSAFQIDWRQIQLTAVFNGEGATVNGGQARSTGIEWNLALVPVTGLKLGFNGAYTDAHLTQDTPASVNGHAGDRLPDVPRFGTSVSIDYEHPLTNALKAFGSVAWRHTGARLSDFDFSGARQTAPAFNIVDLRAGISTDHWTMTGFVKNVGNTIAINYLSAITLAGGFGPLSANVYQPRTFGLSFGFNY